MMVSQLLDNLSTVWPLRWTPFHWSVWLTRRSSRTLLNGYQWWAENIVQSQLWPPSRTHPGPLSTASLCRPLVTNINYPENILSVNRETELCLDIFPSIEKPSTQWIALNHQEVGEEIVALVSFNALKPITVQIRLFFLSVEMLGEYIPLLCLE